MDSLPLYDAYAIAAMTAAIPECSETPPDAIIEFASSCAMAAIEARICAGRTLRAKYGIDINSGRPGIPRVDEDVDLDFSTQ